MTHVSMLHAQTQKMCIFITIVLDYRISREPREGAKCIWGRTGRSESCATEEHVYL